MTADIIRLARRFSELGGTKGIEPRRGMIFLNTSNGLEVLITRVGKTQIYTENGNYNRSAWGYNTPILPCDELWAWLLQRQRRVVQNSNKWENGKFVLQFYHASGLPNRSEWRDDKELTTPSLHHALYSAAVWVAEKEAANGNRP